MQWLDECEAILRALEAGRGMLSRSEQEYKALLFANRFGRALVNAVRDLMPQKETASQSDAEANGLLRDLESTPWHLMRVLGDRAEDAGDEWDAAGWRWLADNRKWPNGSGRPVNQWQWGCFAPAPTSHWPPQETREDTTNSTLPGGAWYLIPHEARVVPHLRDCLLIGAVAVGQWLRGITAARKDQERVQQIRAAVSACTLCGGSGRIVYTAGIRDRCPRCEPLFKEAESLHGHALVSAPAVTGGDHWTSRTQHG